MNNVVYVLQSAGYGKNDVHIDLIKVGYTTDFENRYRTYKVGNPSIKVLYLYDGGTLCTEAALVQYLNKFKYELYGREWFLRDDSIIEFFESNQTLESLENSLKDMDSYKNVRETELKIIREKFLDFFIAFTQLGINITAGDLLDAGITDLDQIYPYLENTITRDQINAVRRSMILTQFELVKNKEAIYEFCTGLLTDFTTFDDRMRFVCTEVPKLDKALADIILALMEVTPQTEDLSRFYKILGPERCKALKYRKQNISAKISSDLIKNSPELAKEVHKRFKIGQRYLKKDIKSILKNIYFDFGINQRASNGQKEVINQIPKAVDIVNWFVVESIKIKSDNGIWIKGFRLVSIK